MRKLIYVLAALILICKANAQYDTHYTPQLKIISADDNTFCAPVLSARSGEGKVIYCNLNISSQAMDAQPDAFKLLANFIAIRYKNKHAN